MALYCILLKDGIATKKSKTLISKNKNQQYQSLQGSLWLMDISQYDGPKFLNPKSDLSKLTVMLKSVEDDSITHVCQASDVARITDVQCQLLKAVSTCADRYKVFQDQPWMRDAVKIDVNSVVYLSNSQGLPDKSIAIVRYKGSVNNMDGIWFGLELSAETKGKGTTDGVFRKERYFTCDQDNGLFVPISKIRRCPESSVFQPNTKNHQNMPVEHQETVDVSPDEPPPELCIGERVVWVDDEDVPHLAIVHWIGRLPDGPDRDWTVGVEFDVKIGTGTGKYKDTQLFKARNGHASLIPILGLMKAEEYYGSKENIPSPMDTYKAKQLASSRDNLLSGGETSHMTSKSQQPTAEQQPKIVLDENYYRESYKTNKLPTKVQSPEKSRVMSPTYPLQPLDVDNRDGGYDVLRGNHTVDPIYASVHEVKNQIVTDGKEEKQAKNNHKGSPSEAIYTLPSRGHKNSSSSSSNSSTTHHHRSHHHQAQGPAPSAQRKANSSDTLIQKRTIVVNADTTLPERHDGMDDQHKLYNKVSPYYSTQNISNNGGSNTNNGVGGGGGASNIGMINPNSKDTPPGYSQSVNNVSVNNTVKTTVSSNLNLPTSTGAMGRRNNSPVMHEDVNNGSSSNTRVLGDNRINLDDSEASGYGLNSHGDQYHDSTLSHQRNGHHQETDQSKLTTKTLNTREISELSQHFSLGSVVEVIGNPAQCKYGVIRWMGYLQDKNKPIVGLEMEEESSACTDGTFGGQRLFECQSKKAFFVYLSKLRKDSRFEESESYMHRTMSQAFGSLECPDIADDIPPMDEIANIRDITGKNKGIQGHHNSCYLDSTLFSFFAFTQTFDSLLFRERNLDDIEQYEDVVHVLKDGIVNPLRKNFFVRADKVLKLRMLLDKLSSVQGLMTEEKDPEEFITSLLQEILKAQPLLKLSNGQTSYLYQLFVEKDEKIMLPTTEQLLELSFLQADLKLSEPPNCLILQMPRFGKEFKMYRRIVPSLNLDITDILEHGPRECHLCGMLATHECRDCFQLGMFESGLSKTAFCAACLQKYHQHRNRQTHKHKLIQPNKEYESSMADHRQRGLSLFDTPMPREIMELFAVVCIETSHYVAFVKCGTGDQAPWVLFDSMADRMGEQNGYNIPEVKRCDFLPDILMDDKKLLQATQDKSDKEMGDLKRLLCDGYIHMYRSKDLHMYN